MNFRDPALLAAAIVAAGLPCNAAAQSGALKALDEQSAVQINCTSETEQQVVESLKAFGWVNLASRTNREIRGACLNALLTVGAKGRPLKINGAHVQDDFVVDFTDVNIALHLEHTTFEGEVKFANSRFRWDVVLDGSIFKKSVDLSGASFEADLCFRNADFHGVLNGYHTRVGGDLEAMRAVFGGDVDLRGLYIRGEAKFERIVAGRFDASRATFEGDLVFTDSWFAGPHALINLERATVKQSLFLNSLNTAAPVVNLVYTEVGYSLGADRNVWDDSVKMRGMRTGMHLDLRYGIFNNHLNLHEARVGGDLRMDSVIVMRDAEMTRTQVAGTVSLRGAEFRRSLSLAETNAGLLKITGLRQPSSPASFSVDGITFGHIESLVNDVSSPDALIGFLGSAAFSPDAYGVLESFFTRHGDKRYANRTLFERRARERHGRPWYLNGGSWLLNGIVRYGRWPALAFLWWAGFVALGTLVFSRARPTLVDRQKTSCPVFDPFWYSLDTFLPMVDLKYADDWKLRRSKHRKAWIYLRGHTLAGWVLIPVALAAISGLLK